MNSNYVSTKANWMLWCIENEDGFTMIGSRKINQLDLEVEYDSFWNDLDLYSGSVSGCIPLPRTYSLTGSLAGFTMVVAKTEFEAFITLMNTFQEEERCEKAEKKAYTARVKEAKKREKAHKKNKKAILEGKFDHPKCPETCQYCIEENEPYGYDYPEDHDCPEWHECDQDFFG